MRSQSYEVTVTDVSGSLGYDSNGNLVTQGTRTFEWDAADRLVRIRDNGTETASFAYDGWGRRVQKISGGTTHEYVHDGENITENGLARRRWDTSMAPATDGPGGSGDSRR